MIVLTLRRSIYSFFFQLNYLKQTTPLPSVIIVTLKNFQGPPRKGQREKRKKEKKGKKGRTEKNMTKKKKRKKIKKSGRDFPYESSLGGIRLNESSLGGIRLMTSPCIRARQELSKKIGQSR